MRLFTAFAVGLATLTAGAQTATQIQPAHIKTALNHFTVIDPGEPVVLFALADHTNFDVEQRENKLFLQPLSPNVATNLLVWTATRELTYEIDPAGNVANMNMLVVSAPAIPAHGHGNPDEKELDRVSTQARDKAVLGTEEITDDQKERPGTVVIRIEGVFRSNDQLIVRYSVHNLSASPFRLTAPDIFESRPTQTPISLLSLRNHQLSDEVFRQFKSVQGQQLSVLHAEVLVTNLTAGQSTIGMTSVRCGDSASPRIYQFDFGSAGGLNITAAVVM